MNRRQFLKTTSLGIFAFGGCSESTVRQRTSTEPTLPADATISGWSMRGRGPAHTAATDATPTLEGTRRWELPLSSQPKTGPVVGGDLLTIGVGRTVLAVSPETGTEIWRASFDAAITGQPVIHDGHVFVGTDELGFYALDGRSGDRVWEHTFDRTYDTWVNTPAVAGDRVFATVNRKADTPTVVCVARDDGERLWEAAVVEEPAHPVLANESLYTYGVVQSPESGEMIRQQSSTPEPSLTPAVTDEGVFLVEAGSRLHRLPEIGATPEWTVDLSQETATMPVVDGERVYVSGRALNLDSGESEYHIDTGTRTPPAVAEDIGLLSRRQSVVAFDPATGAEHWTDEIQQVTRPKQPALTAETAYVAAGDRLIAYR